VQKKFRGPAEDHRRPLTEAEVIAIRAVLRGPSRPIYIVDPRDTEEQPAPREQRKTRRKPKCPK
jgi:hypothetical protein